MPSIDFSDAPSISREFDLSLYSRQALADTQFAFREFCRVSTRPAAPDRLTITVTPLGTQEEEVRQTVLEFWNYLLDRSCQERLA